MMRHQEGFSLLEVVLAMGILMTLIMAVATMLRSSFDMKDGLSQRSRTLHRMQIVMSKLANDMHHAWIIDPKDQARNAIGRTTKGIFAIEKASGGDKVMLTTRTHTPLVAGGHESDTTYVVYELRDSRTAPGRKDLYRGESKVVPEDFREDPPMRLLAQHIKSLTVEWWRGDGWSKDRFDSNRSDTRGKIPRLVRITVEAWTEDREEGDDGGEEADQSTDMLTTVVFIPAALDFEEMRAQDSSIKWSAF